MGDYLEMPQDFTKQVHQALRTWHIRRADDVLSDLLLVQQTKSAQIAAIPCLIGNQVLLDGLEWLKQINIEGSNLLQRRFLNQETALEIAHCCNLSEDVIFQRQRVAIAQLAELIWQKEQALRQKRINQIETRFKPQTHSQLFGISPKLSQLRAKFQTCAAPWFIALEGLGGIGKTALAQALIRDLTLSGTFIDIGWVSAKQQDFLPCIGLQPSLKPALDINTFANTFAHSLLEQFGFTIPASALLPEKMAVLIDLLKTSPYLIVIDNLEKVIDYEAWLATLCRLANPSQFLLTSRHSLRAHPDVFCYPLQELSEANTLALLKYEAQVRGILPLANATQHQLEEIYRVVGGNPLALKLVVGQMAVLPLSQVLENLKKAQGKKIDNLYTYVYGQAWRELDEISREVLLAMPLVQNGDLAQLSAVTNLEMALLNDALENLVNLSLIEVAGSNLSNHRYRIHRLTETFMLTEVTKWQRRS
ncbi:MAG: hypothetical protein KDI79_00085 [Anaerolineae bacterium]|nr:hypothetical protein [Anaerolineae bacterium]